MNETQNENRPVRILSLDTATTVVSVALAHDDKIDVDDNNEANRHTERLLPMVDGLMKSAGLTMKDIDAVAFGAGPGAFTGLRVSCATAQGLAWAVDKPVIAVGNLEAAASRLQTMGVRGRVLVANDARMNECYVQCFDVADETIAALTEPELVKPETAGELAQTQRVKTAAGSAFAVYGEAVGVLEGVDVKPEVEADAADIARVAIQKYARNETTTPQLAAPLYVRNRVALTIEERKAGEKL